MLEYFYRFYENQENREEIRRSEKPQQDIALTGIFVEGNIHKSQRYY